MEINLIIGWIALGLVLGLITWKLLSWARNFLPSQRGWMHYILYPEKEVEDEINKTK